MKTRSDPRHAKRQYIVQELFKTSFHTQPIDQNTKKILAHIEEIDTAIARAAPEYPIDKINRVDLAILRLAVYELLIEQKEPKNVIIDEAVELAKEFGGESSPGVINGALGALLNNEEITNV